MGAHENHVQDYEETLPYKLKEAIHATAKAEGFITYTVVKEDRKLDGASNFGELASVDIKGLTKEGDKELHLFCKLMKNDDKIDLFNVEDLFKKENFVYTELSKVFQDLQNEYKVPEEERYKLVKSFGEACGSDMIVLENMVKKGYETPSRLDVMDLNYASLAMKQLAKLHGLSFALQEKRPEYFQNKLTGFKHLFNFNEAYVSYVQSMCGMVSSCIDEKYKRKVDALTPILVHKSRTYLKDDARCLCHCDFRPNNIMMKRTDGKVTDLIPIDYQLLYYGCPVIDILFFLYNCTDLQFRRNHMEELKRVYYEHLSMFLEYFNVDVNVVYPRAVFESDINDKLDYGLIIALVVLPPLMTVGNNDIDLGDPAKKQVRFDKRFQDRVTEVLDEFIEMGLL